MINQNKISTNIGLNYQTVVIPEGKTKTEFIADVAERLNAKGILPKSARKYNFGIVQNVWAGRYSDENIENEIKLLLNQNQND